MRNTLQIFLKHPVPSTVTCDIFDQQVSGHRGNKSNVADWCFANACAKTDVVRSLMIKSVASTQKYSTF